MLRQVILSLGIAIFTAGAANAGVYEDAVRGVMENRAPAVSAALQKGLDPNTPISGTGDPLITQAIRNGADAVVNELLKHPQLDINRPNSVQETPLMIAVYYKKNDIANKLLDRGAKVNNPNNWSPLHYAASVGNTEMVKTLLAKGANVNARTRRGFTPLYMAARDADYPTVKMLLDAGARKDYCSNDALAPRDIAVQRKNTQEVIDALAYDHCR